VGEGVEIAGLAKNGIPGLEAELTALARALEEATGGKE